MLDSFVLLLEKAFLLANFDFFTLIPFKKERCAKRTEGTMQFQRGDLLEVPRTLFVHFGIYLGDGKVAHLMPDILPVLTRNKCHIEKVVTNKRLLLGVIYKYATIRVDSVEDFAYGSPISLNTMDTTLRNIPLANEEVALRAEKLVGRIPYSLLWNNCEHFVTYCRYGTGVSLQTDKFCERLKSVVRDQRSVLVTTFIGMFSIFFLGLTPATALPAVLVPFVLWMADNRGKKHLKAGTYDISVLKRGDLLEVSRTLFTHYGIYLGGDRVAHLIPDVLPAVSADPGAIAEMVTNKRLLLGVMAKRASVRIDTVADFAYGAEVLVNHVDEVCRLPPLAGEEVASRAEKLLGPVNYSLLWHNCEHYVMYCRYGTSVSFQTYWFCKLVLKTVLSKTSSFLSLLLCLYVVIHLGCLSVCGIVPTMIIMIIPFTIWMAS